MLKKTLKWVVAIVLFVVGLVGLVDALQGLSGSSPASRQAGNADKPAWNTGDVNIQTNGNLQIAASAIKSMSLANGIQHNDPASVIKTPWKYGSM